MKNKTFILLSFLLFFISGNAQLYECTGYSGAGSSDPSRGQTCTNSSAAYLSYYRNKESWYPTTSSIVPIKYLNVAFVIRQKTDADKQNFDETNSQHVQWLNEIVANMNTMLTTIAAPSDPQTSVCGTNCHIIDSRIRINLVNKVFVHNDPFYANGNSIANAVDNSAVMNIFFYGNVQKTDVNGNLLFETDGSPMYIPGGHAGGGSNWMANQLPSLNRGTSSTWGIASNVLHEIFHNYGLMHLYEPTCCHETCDNTNIDYLSDIFGFGPNPNCWQQQFCDPMGVPFCTNGMMGSGVYISPMQLGRLHREMMMSDARRYVCGYSTNPFLVQANETWDFNIKFYQDIIVKSGFTLTLKCQLNMVPQAKIIVEPNARLIIDGGVVTTGVSNGCKSLWQGIQVWGNAAQHQYTYGSNQLYQGFVELKNGAIIENAATAISLGKAGDWQMLYTGGIVQVSGNSIFRNNKRDIEFLKYQNFNPLNSTQKRGNLSYFRNCRFETTANLVDASTPSNHITMWNVDGVKFYGCTFENSNTAATSNTALGNGIYTEDANFVISACDWTVACGPGICCNYAPNTFKNLNNGVWTKKISGTTYNYSIDQANFINCVINVNNEAVDNAIITRNNFTIGKPRFGSFLTIGVNVNTGTNYRVEENIITRDAAPNSISIGTLLTNTGMVNNQVYKNTFTNLNYGNYANQRNRGYNSTTGLYEGLAFLCNTHTTVANYDIYIYGSDPVNDGVRQYQGKLNPANTNAIGSAGNVFTRSGSTSESDIANTNTPNITYFYDGTATLGNTKYPSYVTANRVTRTPITANSCPSSFGAGGSGKNSEMASEINTGKLSASTKQELITEFAEYNQALSQAKNLYQSLLDGGNTNQLKSEVENSAQSETWQLRQKLLGKSPYLSKEVLRETSDKTNVLPDAVLFEILSANPDGLKDEELVKYFSEKINPLPEWMVELLKEGGDQITSRTILEANISHHKAQRDLIASYLVQDILTNREDGEEINHQELRSWLATYKTAHGDYQIVDDFFETGNYSSGLALLSTVPSTYKLNEKEQKEFENMSSLFTILADVNLSRRNILTLSETEMNAVKNIADNGEGVARVRACNLISFVTGEECSYDLKLPDGERSFKTEKPTSAKRNPLLPSISVFPNPAKDYVEFSYTLPVAIEEGTLTITNISGVVVHQQKLNSKYGQIAVDTREWPQGTYVYSLTSNGKTVSNQKFVITK